MTRLVFLTAFALVASVFLCFDGHAQCVSGCVGSSAGGYVIDGGYGCGDGYVVGGDCGCGDGYAMGGDSGCGGEAACDGARQGKHAAKKACRRANRALRKQCKASRRNACGDCATACGGCDGGCDGAGNCGDGYSDGGCYSVEGTVIDGGGVYDGSAPTPAMDDPVPPVPVEATPSPIEDSSASRTDDPVYQLAAFRPRHAEQLSDGLHAFWSGDYRTSGRMLTQAAESNPEDAVARYFLAIVHRRLGNEDAAGAALNAAVATEHRSEVAKWGVVMQRVQGSDRIWIEDARHAAGL